MNEMALLPWMLHADWREDRRPFVTLDLSQWPVDLHVEPLPPVPVIAIGAHGHPRAASADLLVEPGFGFDSLATAIERTPLAAATLVQLLRSIDGLVPARALPLESFAFAALQVGSEHAAWLARQPATAPKPEGALHVARNGNRLDVLIDRPCARNAFDRAMRDALFDAFTLADADPAINQVRLRATGRAFGVGADLAEFGTTRDPVAAAAIRVRTLPAYPMSRHAAIHDVHVQGACVGSALELAAFAGRVTASPNAWFQLPEVGMGILPGFGGCVSIPGRIGRQRAALLMLSGKRIGAATALSWRLVDAIISEPATDHRGTDMPDR